MIDLISGTIHARSSETICKISLGCNGLKNTCTGGGEPSKSWSSASASLATYPDDPSRVFLSNCGLGAIGGDVASLFAPFPPGLAACASFRSTLGLTMVSFSVAGVFDIVSSMTVVEE